MFMSASLIVVVDILNQWSSNLIDHHIHLGTLFKPYIDSIALFEARKIKIYGNKTTKFIF